MILTLPFRLPVAALERELGLSRQEVVTLVEALSSTTQESNRIERELSEIQERKVGNYVI